jgi:hypothetical protein
MLKSQQIFIIHQKECSEYNPECAICLAKLNDLIKSGITTPDLATILYDSCSFHNNWIKAYNAAKSLIDNENSEPPTAEELEFDIYKYIREQEAFDNYHEQREILDEEEKQYLDQDEYFYDE